MSGAKINPESKDATMTLKSALNFHLDNYLEQIEVINESATREYAIE